MKSLLVLASVVLAASAGHFLDEEWTLWKSNYEKKYVNSQEESFRRQIWEGTWEKVQKHNSLAAKGLKNYTLAVNMFADMTKQELMPRSPCSQKHREELKPAIEPKLVTPFICDSEKMKKDEVVDWRHSGCVTDVKNAGRLCPASWAFSAVGVLESRYCIKQGKLFTFSEQQLLDCSDNDGCCDGRVEVNFEYAYHKGMMKKKSYENKQGIDECQYNARKSVKVKISKYYKIIGEESIAHAVAKDGPVAVTFAAGEDFFLYKEGIYAGECSTNPIGMIIVGYGKACGQEYWLLKNSMGKKWGEDGYVRVQRNTNLCKISEHAVTADLI